MNHQAKSKSFIGDPRVGTLKSCLDDIRSKSVRANVTEAFIIWRFPALAMRAGFADAEIYDLSAAAGIHPPDAGSVRLETEHALLVEFQEALAKDDQLAHSFAAWLEDEAKKLEEAGDPAFELITAIAMEALEAEDEGHAGSDSLYGAARDAEDSGDHLRAHHCRQMAELAEEDELLCDLHGNNVIWKTSESWDI